MDTNEDVNLENNTPKEKGSFFKVFFITFLIAVSIRVFVAQPFIVNGQSMQPSFENGEYLVVDELSYHFREPQRGEVIVFRYPKNPSKFFIKRVVGLPQERIEIKGPDVFVIDGSGTRTMLDEPYVQTQQNEAVAVTLGDDEYFVMGDNRNVSSDSRRWGPVAEDLIIGRALFRFLPIQDASVLPGDYSTIFNAQ